MLLLVIQKKAKKVGLQKNQNLLMVVIQTTKLMGRLLQYQNLLLMVHKACSFQKQSQMVQLRFKVMKVVIAQKRNLMIHQMQKFEHCYLKDLWFAEEVFD
jgi:hypothetical protein